MSIASEDSAAKFGRAWNSGKLAQFNYIKKFTDKEAGKLVFGM
jgi:hypothetical protein